MSGQIFISYRREESRWSARSLRDRLCRDFEPKQIFMDIDAIALGEDFVETIETRVAKCDVLIAVIGKNWLISKDDHGNKRLDNPEDFVRMEIGAALQRKIRVIPVLVDGALMPRADDLPEDLKPLVRRNALLITDTSFEGDCQRLVATIKLVLEKAAAEEQERLAAEQRHREEAEARERAERERLEAEERHRAKEERLKAEQRGHEEREELIPQPEKVAKTKPEAEKPSEPEKGVPARTFRFPREIAILVALILIFLVLALLEPAFSSYANLEHIAGQSSFVGIVAMGMTGVMVAGGIDLSVGSVSGMAAAVVAYLLAQGWPVSLAILFSLLAAGAIGLLNGLCVTRFKVSPFVPTLVTLALASAITQVIAGNLIQVSSESLRWLGQGDLFGMPNPFILFCVTALVFWFLLARTAWGRDVYAIGKKEQTARLTDLRVSRLKITVYILSALVAGIAGVMICSYVGAAGPGVGSPSKVLDVIAITVVGGANLSGGKGTILGTFLGAIILAVLSNALVLSGISAIWQEVLVLAMLIFAVPIDYFRKLVGHH